MHSLPNRTSGSTVILSNNELWVAGILASLAYIVSGPWAELGGMLLHDCLTQCADFQLGSGEAWPKVARYRPVCVSKMSQRLL